MTKADLRGTLSLITLGFDQFTLYGADDLAVAQPGGLL